MTPETIADGTVTVVVVELASTEPGPDDPRDGAENLHGARVCRLQRSRGRMTPETDVESSLTPEAGAALQRSRGRMTAETPPPSLRGMRPRPASTEPGPDDPGDVSPTNVVTGTSRVLQRSRGRMTPETARACTAPRRESWCFNGAGAG